MTNRRLVKSGSKVALFRMSIDFNSKAHERYESLQPHCKYHFSSKQNEQTVTVCYEEITKFVRNVIEYDLSTRYNNSSLISVSKIEVIEVYRGSINILFSVMFNILGLISGLKDLYDCIELIRELANIHVTNRLDEQYGDIWDVNTRIIVPCERPYERRKLHRPNDDYLVHTYPRIYSRDAFFYYLLTSNVILLILIIFLVYKAVITMYC